MCMLAVGQADMVSSCGDGVEEGGIWVWVGSRGRGGGGWSRLGEILWLQGAVATCYSEGSLDGVTNEGVGERDDANQPK